MSYSAADLFSDWYKPVDLALSSTTADLRINSINKILETEDIEFWLDLVRMHLGITPLNDEHKQDFIRHFKEEDTTFPIIGNEAIVKTLATITLCFKLELEDDEANDTLCLAILNANFLGQFAPNTDIPILIYATDWFNQAAIRAHNTEGGENIVNAARDKLKKVKFDSNEAILANFQIVINAISESLDAVENVTQANKSVKDEANVLWWLFGEFSSIAKKSFKEVGPEGMAFLGATELYEMSSSAFCFAAGEQFLSKMIELSITKGKQPKTSIFNSANLLTEENRKYILGNHAVSVFTPCLLGISKSLEVEQGDDWSKAYQKQNFSANAKKQFLTSEIAAQVYRELFFVYQLT